jgi:Holliday junction resolvase RusA-like endonuclease
MLLPSKNYKAWHEEQLWALKGSAKYSGAVRIVELAFYPSTLRKSDLTNKAESVMDLLVDAGILEDDNWFIAPVVILRFGGHDKTNPRVEISIH